MSLPIREGTLKNTEQSSYEFSRNINALVVDEIVDVVHKTADLIRDEGYPTMECISGAEALAAITAQNPWLLVVGETLSDMAGHTFLLQLLEEHLAPPCTIMLTKPYSGGGFGRWAEFGPAQKMPNIYLTKPFNPAEFRHFVRLIRDKYERTGTGDMTQENKTENQP